MKTKNCMVILIIISILFFIVHTTYAKRFNKKGYAIDISTKVKKSKVKIWGKITDGKKCSQLNLDVYLNNSVTGQSISFNAFIDDYRPKSRNNFNTKYKSIWHKKKFHTKKGKRSWYVDSFYIKCLE